MTGYADAITRETEYDASLIEGWMRLEHGTLDALDARQFRESIRTAEACIDMAGIADSRALAASYGLATKGEQ